MKKARTYQALALLPPSRRVAVFLARKEADVLHNRCRTF
jgi:hypothetical protein